MEYKNELPLNDALYHHGIKGMRWGIRRYQNKDGSLTKAGQRRYDKELKAVRKEEAVLKKRTSTANKLAKLEARKKAVADKNRELDGDEAQTKKLSKKDAQKAAAKKSIKDMTDEELVAEINRARLEDTYRQLRPAVEKHPMMKKMLNEVIVPAAVNSGRKFLENTISKAAENILKDKVDPNSVAALTKVRDKLKLQKEIEKLKKGVSDDGDLSWDDKLKKQTYERNKKKYAEEDAKAAQNNFKTNSSSQKTKDNDGSGVQEKKQTNSNKSGANDKVHEGTVEGFGKNSKTTNKGERWTTDRKVYDAEYWEVVDDNSSSSGRSYVSDYLSLPAPGLPAARDDY